MADAPAYRARYLRLIDHLRPRVLGHGVACRGCSRPRPLSRWRCGPRAEARAATIRGGLGERGTKTWRRRPRPPVLGLYALVRTSVVRSACALRKCGLVLPRTRVFAIRFALFATLDTVSRVGPPCCPPGPRSAQRQRLCAEHRGVSPWGRLRTGFLFWYCLPFPVRSGKPCGLTMGLRTEMRRYARWRVAGASSWRLPPHWF